MADLKLTAKQIIDKLNTEINFGIQFIVENQPNIVVDRIKADGIKDIDTPAKAYAYLVNLAKIDVNKVKELLNNIPYNPSMDNWTGSNEFDVLFPTVVTKGTGIWGGILSGVGSLFSAVGGAIGSGSSVPGSLLTPAELEALRIEEEKRLEAERVATQRKQLIIAVSILVVIILAVVIYKANKDKKTSK